MWTLALGKMVSTAEFRTARKFWTHFRKKLHLFSSYCGFQHTQDMIHHTVSENLLLYNWYCLECINTVSPIQMYVYLSSLVNYYERPFTYPLMLHYYCNLLSVCWTGVDKAGSKVPTASEYETHQKMKEAN